VTPEDQIASLYAKANPVPTLDLLDPFEQVDLGHLRKQSERRSGMADIQTRRSSKQRRGRRPRLAPIMLALGAVVIAVPMFLTGVASIDSSPAAIGYSYMAALAGHDWEAAKPLFDPTLEEGEAERMTNLPTWAHARAVGWVYSSQGCEEISEGSGGTLVECPFLSQTDWGRALQLEEAKGQVTLLIDEHIQRLTEEVVEEGGLGEGWDRFRAWVEEHHPEDVETMYDFGGGAAVHAEALALWEQYTDEFVAQVEN
jgi:hypothetical protein